MRTSDVDPRDYKYIITKPDTSFSPQRNKALIQETINESTKFFKKLDEELDGDIEDRIDILSSFARYKFAKNGGKTYEQYVGREWRRKLIGEKILSKVRALESVDKLGKKDYRILL